MLTRRTQYPAIKNGPLPADAAGNDTFSNTYLISLLALTPLYLSWKVGGGTKTWILFSLVTSIPILAVFWMLASGMSPRKTEKAKYPGLPVEHYLRFPRESDRLKYKGKNKIPMETFHEMYFDGNVDFNGDALEIMEYRHDWASFQFTLSLYWFFLTGFLPEMIMHTRSQGEHAPADLNFDSTAVAAANPQLRVDEEQVRDHYDRGDDFYGWFLGPRMVYTSGIVSDITREESLEQLQDNKLAIVCEKIGLKRGDTVLDIGCGWGTLARYASVNYGALVTGATLGRNQTAWGNNGLRKDCVPESQSRILCMDYRDIPLPQSNEGNGNGVGYDKITCLEMAEHVGVRHFSGFLKQVYDMLDDDGVFFLQIAGIRKSWQYEDLIWGLFMNKYVFPGADASTPLGWFVDQLEGAGFEVKGIDTIGVHYSATIWRWYRNWMANKDKVEAKYGKRWFRVSRNSKTTGEAHGGGSNNSFGQIWEYFLAYSTIIPRQGSAACYQITLVKNINSTHRIEGVSSQFGLLGALAAAKVAVATNKAAGLAANVASNVAGKVSQAVGR